mmetsp:Transcript_35273/g.84078  ORF Transcript_35273/g.84078 Transcript_35273/m.84078 type:complete len:579 (-) Transcript_35273:86-1822(-)
MKGSGVLCLAVALALAGAAHAQSDDNLPLLAGTDVSLSLNALKTLGDSPLAVVGLLADGELTPLAGMARSIPVPPTVDVAYLDWQSDAEYGYDIQLVSSDPDVMETPTLNFPNRGIVPSETGEIAVSMECTGEGTVEVTLQMFFFTYEGQDDGSDFVYDGETSLEMTSKTDIIEVVYAKQCSTDLGPATALPAMCLGSDDEGAPARGGAINVATWNVAGFLQDSSETSITQAEEVASQLSASAKDYSVVVVQDAWAPDFVSTLKQEMKDAGFGYVVDVIKPVDSDQTSGMMFFSKLPVRGCFYEKFAELAGTDVVKMKGVFGALVDAGAGYSYVVTTAHGNTDPWQYEDVRESQLEQIVDATSSYIAELADEDCDSKECELFGGLDGLAKMGVILAGTLNVNSIAYTDGVATGADAEAYANAVEALSQLDSAPRDWYREAHADDLGLTTIPLSLTCPEDGYTPFFECEAGAQVTFPGSRVDYLMSWDVVKGYPDDFAMNSLAVSNVEVTSPMPDSSSNFLAIGEDDFEGLSYHKLMSATVDHTDDATGDDDGEATAASQAGLALVAAAAAAVVAAQLA